MEFPIDTSAYKPLAFSPEHELTEKEHAQLAVNIKVVRDAIVFMTAYSNSKGYGGHTGGAYDIVPEVLIIDAFRKGSSLIHPDFFDEAGHRVAVQYILAALEGKIPLEKLLHYREHGHGLYGHPEIGVTLASTHSSGRLGHSWGFVNGVAEANPEKKIVIFGSDGAQMEGNNAEAARYCVANNLNVLLVIDDNNVTIEGHPAATQSADGYMKGYDLAKTLQGHGLACDEGRGEDLPALYDRIRTALHSTGPIALINKRNMAPGVAGIEGKTMGHDAIAPELGVNHLAGNHQAVELLANVQKPTGQRKLLGSSEKTGKNRLVFGETVVSILDREGAEKVLVVSNDLGGSCGLSLIKEKYPGAYRMAGPMERNNFLVAAGFGAKSGHQGIYGTFSAFLEMITSEITMARLNNSNVLAHFSHTGVDDMSDNTCHFGINNFFADNGLADTMLYFPADPLQMKAVVETVFHDSGLRFIFSTRSASPYILDEKGNNYFGEGYRFIPGKDEIIRKGSRGYVVSYGCDMLYRCLDAVERLRSEGLDVGLVNKPTLNAADEEMLKVLGKSPFVLLVESQNERTGLGIRLGSWMLERGLTTRYIHIGVHKPGMGGMHEQTIYQHLDPDSILKKIKEMLKATE